VDEAHPVDGSRASIFDVARRAGVSPSTVSRALRGLPNVAESTRDRVTSAARDLDYIASPAAAGLASGRTATVGVVVPYLTRWFFMQVIHGAESVLRTAGYDLLLHTLGDAAGRERFFGRLPLHRKVDGVMLIDVTVQPDEQAGLQALGIPVTVVGGSALGVGYVGVDEEEGVRLAVQHLVHLGHERIAMLCGRPAEGMDFDIPGRRRAAFVSALADAGLPADLLVVGEWGTDGGAEATERLLSESRTTPTAIVAESDEIAFGALRTLRRAGISVPGRMSLVGYDDHELAGVVDLTTVAQPVARQGELAAELLLDAMRGTADPFARILLPPRLVIRGSTAPPRER
jgi:LacI family transcriptional regulator, repressor for deo operon, udp, cdd, tsx, nupC, and nupG